MLRSNTEWAKATQRIFAAALLSSLFIGCAMTAGEIRESGVEFVAKSSSPPNVSLNCVAHAAAERGRGLVIQMKEGVPPLPAEVWIYGSAGDGPALFMVVRTEPADNGSIIISRITKQILAGHEQFAKRLVDGC